MLIGMIAVSLLPSAIFAQTPSNVKVTVMDSASIPLVGVGVVTSNSSHGGITDIDGTIILKVGPDEVLEISCLGYETVSVPVSGRKAIVVTLREESLLLEDVVVIGYGVQKRETVTGSISQVSGKDLIKSPVGNISNALVGRVSGLSSVQASGEAGFDETTIRIRGVGTYNGDQNPLVVIDGVIRDMASFNMLNPNDIEGMNILKDASATAVYGVRGANGVIIVTTKRGHTGRAKVSLSANFGITTPTTLISLVNSYDYAVLKNEALRNDGYLTSAKLFSEDELWKLKNNRDYTPAEVAAMSNLTEAQKQDLLRQNAAFFGSTNYMEGIFAAQVAPVQQYNVDISGGTKDVKYYASVGYHNQKSLTNDYGFSQSAANSGSDRISFRTNFDFTMIPYTEIKVSLSGQMQESKSITGKDNSTSMASRYHALLLTIYEAPPFSGAGVYGNKLIRDYAGDGMMHVNKNAWGKTPIAYMLEKSQVRTSRTSLNASINLVHKMDYLTKGLALRAAVAYDHYFTKDLLVSSDIPTYELWTGYGEKGGTGRLPVVDCRKQRFG